MSLLTEFIPTAFSIKVAVLNTNYLQTLIQLQFHLTCNVHLPLASLIDSEKPLTLTA